ncbi:MAG: aminoacyl-tRNA hydrolase [Lentisphaerae bacterium RIFOXYB12_FULL_65_16]|nr:MAG: aminoacyl-tRNA hydrolase [Lentisphaerae bacterium RIFOXYA12_64_32]OGV90248.1 MAG: aminoacyl-tRNA hydrolase [Lentisphaerae bacterium RIFOXYB12_FULL_65_16]
MSGRLVDGASTEPGPRLIVGLGNPGLAYEATRHNVGFLVLDRILERAGRCFQKESRSDRILLDVEYEGLALTLVKPLRFMNASGEVVAEVVRERNTAPNELMVVADCLDLPLGRLRLRKAGSSGGHRGLDSIIRELGSDVFARSRVGIGRPDGEAVDYVLSRWSDADLPLVRQVIETATEAVLVAAVSGVDAAMNRYNGLNLAEPPEAEQEEE